MYPCNETDFFVLVFDFLFSFRVLQVKLNHNQTGVFLFCFVLFSFFIFGQQAWQLVIKEICSVLLSVFFQVKLDHNQTGGSRVVHIRGLPSDANELEVISLGAPFGKVTNILLLKQKSQVSYNFYVMFL